MRKTHIPLRKTSLALFAEVSFLQVFFALFIRANVKNKVACKQGFLLKIY